MISQTDKFFGAWLVQASRTPSNRFFLLAGFVKICSCDEQPVILSF
jgi:hypothetical protein